MPAKTKMYPEYISLMSGLPKMLQKVHLDNERKAPKMLQKVHLDNERKAKPYELFKGRKNENIQRCIDLLEHTGGCKDPKSCKEGEGCRRTKQVLAHYKTCLKPRKECSICYQFMALCEIHAERCQNKLVCNVPHSPNEKQPLPHLLKEMLGKSNLDSVEKSEEYMQVVRKLVKALRMPTVAEKKQHILNLFKSDPQTTSDLLRKLYKMKRSKISSNHVSSSVELSKETSCSQVAGKIVSSDSDEPMDDTPVVYQAKLPFLQT